MIKKMILSMIVLPLSMLCSCNSATNLQKDYAFFDFDTECIANESTGVVSVRTWGTGINKADAIENAKRKAIETVIFEGFRGKFICRPLIMTPNAKEQFRDYLNNFFSSKEYTQYIRIEKNSELQIKASAAARENWGIVTIINREALRKRLIKDHIIKQ